MKFHEVENLQFVADTMSMSIDGKSYSFDLKEHSKVLFNATEKERNLFEVEESGYGIHWPLIDEDLSIDGLLGIYHEPPAHLQIKVNA